MKRYFFGLLSLLIAFSGSGQALRDINFKYLYDPAEIVNLKIQPVRKEQWKIFYSLEARDSSQKGKFSIEWGLRDNVSDKESRKLSLDSVALSGLTGSFELPLSEKPVILVAKVINLELKRAWFFYQVLEPKYPVNISVLENDEPLMARYVHITDDVKFSGNGTETVSYYNDAFPVAQPPFAEAQGRVSKGMKVDSLFTVNDGAGVSFSSKGLYLVQRDTNSAEGITIRAEDDYPRLARIPSIAGPMVYITTSQEYDRMLKAKNDKKSFDKVILGITNDTDRAKKLMRNYFKRVDFANQLFSSYKEGWKTDRGMIYIVFGPPEEVFKFNDREVWSYKNEYYRETFTFIKSSSVFDPDNYVLIRDKKYQQTWYEVIDLWRSARF